MHIKSPLILLGTLLALGLSSIRQPFAMAKGDGENIAYLETQENVVETQSYYAGVYLNTHEEISALSIEVHFNPEVVSISSTYNSVSNEMYDSVIHDENITYTYIFSSFTLDSNQRLFYFYYQVKDGVTEGRYYFDIVISEAYGSSLESIEISSSRKYINVSNKSSLKSSYAYVNGSSDISLSYNETSTINYYLDNSEPSSGSLVIHYDDTLFEIVSFTKGNFFNNMICDYNTSLAGEVLVSFAEITSDNNVNLFSFTIRCIKNVDVNSQITLTANELFDSDMNPMGFTSQSVGISISYDSSYETNPAMTVSSEIDTVNKLVVFTINLEEDSHLGAGDFVFSFDLDVLTYVGYEKLFFPTSFLVNDKASQLEQGRIKFSIISTTDIVEGGDILRVTFSYENARNDRQSTVNLTGSGLVDSLTEPIELDISGTDFVILGVDLVVLWIGSYLYMDDPSFDGEGTGRCKTDNLYSTAKEELLKLDDESISDFRNNVGNKYTLALERYLAWAVANNDSTPFSDIVPINPSLSNVQTSDSYSIIIFVITISSVLA